MKPDMDIELSKQDCLSIVLFALNHFDNRISSEGKGSEVRPEKAAYLSEMRKKVFQSSNDELIDLVEAILPYLKESAPTLELSVRHSPPVSEGMR